MTLKVNKLKSFFRSRSRSQTGDSASRQAESPSGSLSQGKVQEKAHTQVTQLPGDLSPPCSQQMNDKSWAEAHSRLSNKEQEVIARSLTADRGDTDLIPEIILRDVRAKREICDKKRWTFRCGDHTVQLRDTADKVLNWLVKLKAAGDIVSNVDPLHAGVPWAGIRFLIQVLVPRTCVFQSLTWCRWFNQSETRWKLFSVALIGSAISSIGADYMKFSSSHPKARLKHARTSNWL